MLLTPLGFSFHLDAGLITSYYLVALDTFKKKNLRLSWWGGRGGGKDLPCFPLVQLPPIHPKLFEWAWQMEYSQDAEGTQSFLHPGRSSVCKGPAPGDPGAVLRLGREEWSGHTGDPLASDISRPAQSPMRGKACLSLQTEEEAGLP